MAGATGLNIRQWATGYGHETDTHFLKLEFVNGTSITVALKPKEAGEEMAEALLKQVRKPPKPGRLS